MRICLVLALAACHHTDGDDSGGPPDSGTPPPPPPPRLLDDDHVLVLPDGPSLSLVRRDGTRAWERTWEELFGDCALCGAEGATADGDGILVSFTTEGPQSGGAIGRVNGAGGPELRVDGFVFPHDAIRDPADGSIIVPEATADRVSWVLPGPTPELVRRLDEDDPAWMEDTPNGLEHLELDGRSLLVISHRGQEGGKANTGEITMWDITDPDAPGLLWVFPEHDSVSMPHGAVFRYYGERWWMLYAHSRGAEGGSTVGLAVTDDPTVRPTYVADLLPPSEVAPFEFLRGVELTDDGELWLTDSGIGGFGHGRLLMSSMPDLPESALSGSIGDQNFVELGPTEVVMEELYNPFEAWLWLPTWEL